MKSMMMLHQNCGRALIPRRSTLGVLTRPLALLLALYTLGTALIAHHFWTMEGGDRYANAINFYKNISIIGGLLLLYVTGAGKYSVDARCGIWPRCS
jgi:putative oxidoreductase